MAVCLLRSPFARTVPLPMSTPFTTRLADLQKEKFTALCVGLDPDPERLPAAVAPEDDLLEATRRFSEAIIDATAPLACAFKLNFAFYEALGPGGWGVLRDTLDYLPDDVLVIADVKRGDIGNTARFYAASLFDDLGVDACTVSPYMGQDTVLPFLERQGTAAFVLARTSNAGANDFQLCTTDGEALYRRVGRYVRDWAADTPGEAGLVVGATKPDAIAQLRAACPALPFLIPGVGAQGGSLKTAMELGTTGDGTVLISSSRSILYASDGEDFAEAAAREAEAFHDTMRPYLAQS